VIVLSETGLERERPVASCGGGPILDLALCLILSVTIVGLLMLAL